MRFKYQYQPSVDIPFVYLAVLGVAVVALLMQVLGGSPVPELNPTTMTVLVVVALVVAMAVVVAMRWRGRGGEDEDEDEGE